MRDRAFTVTNGRVVKARRLDNSHHEHLGMKANKTWEVTVEPSGTGDVTVSLPATTDCSATGAVCTEDGRMLSAGIEMMVPAEGATVAAAPLTASFVKMPGEHDGQSDITFEVHFSEAFFIRCGPGTLRRQPAAGEPASLPPAAAPTWIEADVADPGIARFFSEVRPQAVVHLAARPSVLESLREPLRGATVNVCGTVNVLEQSRACGVRRFIFASTGGAGRRSTRFRPRRCTCTFRPEQFCSGVRRPLPAGWRSSAPRSATPPARVRASKTEPAFPSPVPGRSTARSVPAAGPATTATGAPCRRPGSAPPPASCYGMDASRFPAPLADDAYGRLFGLAGSWEVFDAFYVKGAWSRETKEFGNEVARTPVDLDSRQTISTLGAGYHFEVAEQTSLYAEAPMIVDFEVEHSIPLVTPSAFGPPTVTTTRSVIEGNGLGGALGIRHWVSANVELEGELSRIHTSADVPRTGAEISDSETMLRIAAHAHAGGGVSVGAYLSYSKHTDDNFDDIRKLDVSLRYHF